MAKKTALLAVDPVNGSGLFQYLEAFYENEIPFEVFAVADTAQISTNSGITLITHGVVAELKGRSDRYDALVFACGDAIPKFSENGHRQFNVDMLQVIKEFAEAGKIMAGHCAAALMFEIAGVTDGKTVSTHPFVKGAIAKGTATDSLYERDGNFITAQTENAIPAMIGELLGALK